MSNAWKQTYTGVRLDLIDIDPSAIRLIDIAHALAGINRFDGHTRVPYSVAEHSVRVATFLRATGASLADIREGLGHDGHEAGTGDMGTPTKIAFQARGIDTSPVFGPIKRAYRIAMGLDPDDMPTSVRRADLVLLATEAADLMAEPPEPWQHTENGIEPMAGPTIIPWSAHEAENRFLALAYTLDLRIGTTPNPEAKRRIALCTECNAIVPTECLRITRRHGRRCDYCEMYR